MTFKKRWGWRRIHKWLAVTAGVVLTVWIVSGVIIAIPGGGATRFRQLQPSIDASAITVAPADAAATLEARGARADQIRGISLRFLGSRPIYQVQVAGEGPSLVDARSGDIVRIDEAEALRIVRDHYGGSGSASEPEIVTGYSFRYFVGALPAYRITFSDEFDTEAYVAQRDGTITWWDGRARTRRLMAAAHDWWPIGTVSSPRIRLLLLTAAGAISLAATLTGYWLALRRRRRRA